MPQELLAVTELLEAPEVFLASPEEVLVGPEELEELLAALEASLAAPDSSQGLVAGPEELPAAPPRPRQAPPERKVQFVSGEMVRSGHFWPFCGGDHMAGLPGAPAGAGGISRSGK